MDNITTENVQENSSISNSREIELRELFLEKNRVENQIKQCSAVRQSIAERIEQRKTNLDNAPTPAKMRVFALIILGIAFLRLYYCLMLAGEGPSWGIYQFLCTVPPYLIMTGALARASKRSAALTWFNLLTFGIFGLAFAITMFVKSFLIKPWQIQNEIDSLKKDAIAIDYDIEQQKKQLIHIEAQIYYLTGRY